MSTLPLIRRIEGLGASERAMSMVALVPLNTDVMFGFFLLCQLQGSQSTGLTVHAEVKAQKQKLTRAGVPLCGRLMRVVWVLAKLLLQRAVFSGMQMPTI